MSSTASKQLVNSGITLRGSAQMVSEYFNFAIHSILYQRGIYPSENFTRKQAYGLTLLMSTDNKVNDYLSKTLGQVKEWLEKKKVKKLVLVLTNVDNNETIERWEFNVTNEGASNSDESEMSSKDEKKVKQDIRDVIRQITASVTFLPFIDCLCSFDILIYTFKDLEVPESFSESDAKLIEGCEVVNMKAFSTGIHKVDTAVCYKPEL